MADGGYDHCINQTKASCVARLMWEMLQRRTGLSIGIVVFSEACQSEIEDAFDRFGVEDEVASIMLAREMGRAEEDEFTGLFVKSSAGL